MPTKLVSIASFFLVTLFLSPSLASATDYYVDCNQGNNANSGTSTSQAWKTINQITTFGYSQGYKPGDNINFKRGCTFNSNTWAGVEMYWSGTSPQPITITSYGDTNLPLPDLKAANYSIYIDASYIVVDSVKVSDSDRGVFMASQVHNNVIKNSEATNTGTGFNAYGSYHLLTHNKAYNLRMITNTPGGDDDTGAVGYLIISKDSEFSYNSCFNCIADSYDYVTDGGGFEIYAYNTDVTGNSIHHNWVADSDGFLEIGAQPYTNWIVDNNTVSYNVSVNNGYRVLHINLGNYQYSVSVNNLKFHHNTAVINDSTNYWRPVVYFVNGELTGNQLQLQNNIFDGYMFLAKRTDNDNAYPQNFIHTNNLYTQLDTSKNTLDSTELNQPADFEYRIQNYFVLKSTSPAIDKGANLGYQSDYLGISVPQGSAPDMGAYEYTGSTSPTPTPSPDPSTKLRCGDPCTSSQECYTIDPQNPYLYECWEGICQIEACMGQSCTCTYSPSPTPSPSPSPDTCPADIYQDGFIDITDFSILSANFLSTNPSNPRADIYPDGIVDLTDFSILSKNFLQTCN